MRDASHTPTVAFHPAVTQAAVCFGPFRYDWADRTLTRDGQEVRLPPRALAILAYLLERPGRIVSKQELMDAVWKEAFVSESSLTEAVGVLRQALGDTAAEAAFIQTVHRRGYRFTAAIQIETPTPPAPDQVVVPPQTGEAVVVAPEPTTHRRPRVWAAVALVAAAVVAIIIWTTLRPAPAPAVTRATLTLPESIAPAPGLSAHTVMAVSPDGRRVAYVAGSTGAYRLYLRALDRFDAVPIPGTDSAHGVFFSPDGSQIGFFRGGRLFVARLPDGEPLDIAAAGAGLGGWWHSDDTIVIATGAGGGLMRVPATGGTATPVPTGTLPPGSLRHPSVTPDGRTILATHWKLNVRQSEVVAIDVATGTSRVLAAGVHPRPMNDGQVVYLRDGQLMTLPLDGATAPQPVLNGVMTGVSAAGQYALAANGTLVYLPDQPSRTLRRLMRVHGGGAQESLPLEPRAYQNIAVSPDAARVATTIYEHGASDLWVGDLRRGTLLRITSEGGVLEPVWSADGQFVYFASSRTGEYRLYRASAAGDGGVAVVHATPGLVPTSAGDGFLLVQRVGGDGRSDLLRLDLDGEGELSDWLVTPASEGGARLSPDGRWVAYESTRTGRNEVFLRSLGGGPEVQVTAEGGSQPGWTADGRGLVVTARRQVWRYPIAQGRLGQPSSVWSDPSLVFARPVGEDVLALTMIEESRPLTTLRVVVNWVSEVRAQLRQ